MIRAALLALLLAVAGASSPARAGEAAPPAHHWRAGLALSGQWSRTWVDSELGHNEIFTDAFGNLHPIPMGTDSFELTPDGFALDARLRAWLPLGLAGGQPWLGGGYRATFGGTEDDHISAFPAGIVTPLSGLRVKLRRAATVRLGLDYELGPPGVGRALVLSPVLGADFAWFQARLQSSGLLFPAFDQTETDVFGGVTAGAEARVPIASGGRWRLEVALSALYTHYFGSREIATTAGGFGGIVPVVRDSARYAPGNALAVDFGAVLSLW